MLITGMAPVMQYPTNISNNVHINHPNIKSMIKELHKPAECQKVYTRLINDINFPTLVQFDWR